MAIFNSKLLVYQRVTGYIGMSWNSEACFTRSFQHGNPPTTTGSYMALSKKCGTRYPKIQDLSRLIMFFHQHNDENTKYPGKLPWKTTIRSFMGQPLVFHIFQVAIFGCNSISRHTAFTVTKQCSKLWFNRGSQLMSGDYPQYIEHDKVVPPQLLMAYNPMKTSSVYHQQKPEWNWTYFHQLTD